MTTKDSCVRHSTFVQEAKEIAQQLGFTWETEGYTETIKTPATTYRIERVNEHQHVWGDGGHSLYQSRLFREDTPAVCLLETKNWASWGTYCDDSEDYETGREQNTTLHIEDEFALAIFSRICPR